jgi:hypothetical protein
MPSGCPIESPAWTMDLIDFNKSAAHFKSAGEQTFPDVIFGYGHCLTIGHGVPIDLKQVANYSKLTEDQNFAQARFYDAICLACGQ